MSVDLAGVLVPCTTPFDPVTGDVDLVGFRANVRIFLAHSVRGIVVGGSTGEAVLLDEDERMVLLQGARDLVPDDRLVVAGTGAESTRTTIRRCEESAGMGADAVLVQPPAFYRGAMTDTALLEHYRAVAAASPIPVTVVRPRTVGRDCSDHGGPGDRLVRPHPTRAAPASVRTPSIFQKTLTEHRDYVVFR